MPEVQSNKFDEQLFDAVRSGDLKNAENAIKKGANVKAKNEITDNTLLHLAARKGHLNIVKYLISKGADVHAKGMFRYTPLHVAAENGHLNVVKFLISKDADVYAKGSNGYIPLYEAALEGHLDVVKFFISKDVDIHHAQDKFGHIPLHFAACGGHLNVVEFLLRKDADDANAKNKNDHTPLYLAALKGHLDVANLLVNKGADINAKSEDGFTPLHEAAREGHLDVANLLILHTLLLDSNGGEPVFITNTLELSEFWNNCKREVQKMQTENSSLFELLRDPNKKIGNSTISLYRFLFECNKNRLAGYLSDQETGLQSTLEDFIQKYPDIAEISRIASQYRRGIERAELLGKCDKVIQNFDFDGRSGKELPVEIRKKIAHYLTNEDLKNLDSALNGRKGVVASFIKTYDRTFKIVSGLSLMVGVASCVYGCFVVGIFLLIVGAFVFGLLTEIGCKACEKVSSKFNNPDIAEPENTVKVS